MPRHRRLASAARGRLRQSAGSGRRARHDGMEGSARATGEPGTDPVRNRSEARRGERNGLARSARRGLAGRGVRASSANAPPARCLPGRTRRARRVTPAQRAAANPAARHRFRARCVANRPTGPGNPIGPRDHGPAIPGANAQCGKIDVRRRTATNRAPARARSAHRQGLRYDLSFDPAETTAASSVRVRQHRPSINRVNGRDRRTFGSTIWSGRTTKRRSGRRRASPSVP